MPEDVALREDVPTEPLGGCYAWLRGSSRLASALLNQSVHLPILQPYPSSPSAHESAVADPSFRGIPFVDVERDRSEEISELVSETEQSRAFVLRVGRDLYALEMAAGSVFGVSDPEFVRTPPHEILSRHGRRAHGIGGYAAPR